MIGGYTAAYGTGCGVGNTGRWLGWLQDGMLRQGSFARLNLSLQPEQRLELCVIIATLLMNSAITTTVELRLQYQAVGRYYPASYSKWKEP
jgi:hypothetical protein